MKTYFPTQNKQYIQTNRSNVFGNLWSSFGLDFQTNLGVMRVSPRLKLNCSTADLTNLGLPISFRYFDSTMFCIAGARVFKNTGNFSTTQFVEDASTGFQTTFNSYSDLETIGGYLVASTDTALYKKASSGSGTGAYTKVGDLTSSGNHKMTYFKKFDRVYILDNNYGVSSAPSSLASVVLDNGTNDYTIQLANPGGDKYFTNCIRSNSNFIYIGTQSQSTDDKANRGAIMEWDGISQQVTNEYKINAHGCVALVMDGEIPYAMDTNGCLLKYSGYNFEEVGRLPINKKLLVNAGQSIGDQFINANGLIVTKNNTILALVNGKNADGTQNENFISGIYEFDKKGSCIQRYVLTYNPIASSTITDYGQEMVQAVGALCDVSTFNYSTLGNIANVLVGCNYIGSDGLTTFGIFVDNFSDSIQKKGYFVTTFFSSEEMEENWTRLWTAYRRFLDSNDTIVFKYRNIEEAPIEALITWVDTTHFTTTTDISGYGNNATGFDGTTGGEVEVLRSTGSGSCVHITNISLNAGTYTVTIDTAITGVSGISRARFQKWIKIGTIDSTRGQVKSWQQLAIANSNENRIQIKCCFTFTGEDEFYSTVINSSTNVKITS